MAAFVTNFLLIFFFLFFGVSICQNDKDILSNLEFVNYDENYIHFYNDNSSLKIFYRKLNNLLINKKGKVSIIQIGGSHIQAEIWSDQARNNFLALANDINGGRGFVFPFKIAKTWNPKNHQIHYTGVWKAQRNSIKKHNATWGVSGITVSTKDTLTSFSIGYKHDSLTNYSFNTIKIFHEINDTSFEVDLVSENISEKILNSEMGYTEFVLENESDTLSIEIKKTKPNQDHFDLYGISLENNSPGIVYTSLGVNGAKTSSFLRNELFVRQLQTINPDLVILCLGINDALHSNFCKSCYKENYEKLIKRIKIVNPKVDILFVTNNDSYYKGKYVNENVFAAREVLVKLAKELNAGLWDLFEVMGGLGSVKIWEKRGYAKKDKIHFTDKGYQLLGDLMFLAIMKDFKNFNKNKN